MVSTWFDWEIGFGKGKESRDRGTGCLTLQAELCEYLTVYTDTNA